MKCGARLVHCLWDDFSARWLDGGDLDGPSRSRSASSAACEGPSGRVPHDTTAITAQGDRGDEGDPAYEKEHALPQLASRRGLLHDRSALVPTGASAARGTRRRGPSAPRLHVREAEGVATCEGLLGGHALADHRVGVDLARKHELEREEVAHLERLDRRCTTSPSARERSAMRTGSGCSGVERTGQTRSLVSVWRYKPGDVGEGRNELTTVVTANRPSRRTASWA